MIITEEVTKLLNRKLKRDRFLKKIKDRRIRRRSKKIVRILQNLYIQGNKLNVVFDSSVLSYLPQDTEDIMKYLQDTGQIKYEKEGPYYKIQILTQEDLIKEKKPIKSLEKSAPISIFDNENDIISIKNEEVENGSMFEEN